MTTPPPPVVSFSLSVDCSAYSNDSFDPSDDEACDYFFDFFHELVDILADSSSAAVTFHTAHSFAFGEIGDRLIHIALERQKEEKATSLVWYQLNQDSQDVTFAIRSQLQSVRAVCDTPQLRPPYAEDETPPLYVERERSGEIEFIVQSRTTAKIVLGGKGDLFLPDRLSTFEEICLALETKKPVFLLGFAGGHALEAVCRLKGVDRGGDFGAPSEAAAGEYNAYVESHKEKRPLLRAFRPLEGQQQDSWSKALCNGLNEEDNEILVDCVDTEECARLIMKGMAALEAGREVSSA